MAPSPVPDWLQVAVACASVLGSISVVVAVATFWFQWRKSEQERIDRKSELAALQKAERDRIAAQARRILPEITRSAFFGENVWLGHIQNSSTGAISELRVVVHAVDNDGNQVADGFRKATGELDISGGLHRIVSEALSGSLGGAFGSNSMTRMLAGQLPRNALVSQIAPEVSRQLQVGLMGQLQKDWPSSLGPGQSTSVAYRAARPDLQLHIGIRFEDEAGYEWDRVNQNQPTRVEEDDDDNAAG
jgi:hypothetical protein